MNRISTTIIVALFAVAALEFGIFGVSASGITGGGNELPPIGDRMGVVEATFTPVPTATPCIGAACPTPTSLTYKTVTPTAWPQLSPPSVVAGITIIADPLAIHCDGSEAARVRVRILDVKGDPAPDGIPVYFAPYNGNAEPYYAYTQDGYAQTDVRFYDDIFPYGPNLIVRADLLEAGIRILCFPQSDECEFSTPPDSSCVPTATPTFVSPPSCNPSPGSDPLSPPCASPTPECQLSPPSVSPPPLFSPPCITPPVSPPSAPFELAIDCDPALFGLQRGCAFTGTSPVDVDIVLINRSGAERSVGAFNFILNNGDISALLPLPGVDGNLDANPDFNESALGEDGWNCTPPAPSPDTQDNDLGTTSFLSCYSSDLNTVPSIADGDSIVLATVHFTSRALDRYADLALTDVALYDADLEEIGSCNPEITNAMSCADNYVEVHAPSAFSMAVDCDTTAPGVQSSCDVAIGSSSRDVGIVLVNDGPGSQVFATFNFVLHGGDTSRLDPPESSEGNLDDNPDFNQAEINAPFWQCSPPQPIADQGFDGPGKSHSLLSCYSPAVNSPVLGPLSSKTLAIVHFDIPTNAQPGKVQFSLSRTEVFDQYFTAIGTCDPGRDPQFLSCDGATITLVGAPEPTQTATVPPATDTPVPPTATSTPLPPRCADVNGNGRVNMSDVFRVFAKVRAGVYDERYDINRDGKLTMADVRAAYQQRGDRCPS